MKKLISGMILCACWCFVMAAVHAAEDKPATSDPASQVKEMLMQAASQAVNIASQKDAYFSHADIKIPFPPDLDDVQTQLTRAGEATAEQVNESVKLMNATADEAAKSVLPLLQKAIGDLKIEDASSILAGDAHAATDYFKKETKSLKYSYKPTVKEAMDKVGIEKVWKPLLVVYSDLPENDAVVDQDQQYVPEGFDLNFYISDRAMEGLYTLMAAEEAKIRAKP